MEGGPSVKGGPEWKEGQSGTWARVERGAGVKVGARSGRLGRSGGCTERRLGPKVEGGPVWKEGGIVEDGTTVEGRDRVEDQGRWRQDGWQEQSEGRGHTEWKAMT